MQQILKRILMIQPVAALAQIYSGHLEKSGFLVQHAVTAADGMAKMAAEEYGTILIDCQLDRGEIHSLLGQIDQTQKSPALILICGQNDEAFVKSMLRKGMHDFLNKPVNGLRLVTTIKNTLKHIQMQDMITRYGEESDLSGLHGLMGSSVAMQTVYKAIRNVAGTDSPVYIKGEEGTEKAQCAAAIHKTSPRADKPFIAVDCATVTVDPAYYDAAAVGDNLDTILFGDPVVIQNQMDGEKSVLSKAKGGTVFLDNIGHMPLRLQQKLLVFIRTGRVPGHGLSSAENNVSIRLITGTSMSLKNEVARGNFSEELYSHLALLPLTLPALRDRGDDIIMLAHHHLDLLAKQTGKAAMPLTASLITKLKNHPWPHNMRELQGWLNSLVGLRAYHNVTPLTAVPTGIADAVENAGKGENSFDTKPTAANLLSLPLNQALSQAMNQAGLCAESCKLDDFERWIIESRIKANDGSIPKAAESLGISPSTIYRKKEGWVKKLDVISN